MSVALGTTQKLPQANGSEVDLIVLGDEFSARYETPDGYSVIYDYSRGLFCYAGVATSEFVSTGVPVTQNVPSGTARHLQESPRVVAANTQRIQAIMRDGPASQKNPLDTMRTFGPDRGLLSGRKVGSGNVKGLTVLVNFKDLASTVTVDDVSSMLNDLDYSAQGITARSGANSRLCLLSASTILIWLSAQSL